MAEWTTARIIERITAEATRQGVDPKLALAVATQESSLNPNAVGDNGQSLGLFQLQRAAAIDAGIDPARRGDPDLNITGGVTYLKQKLQQSGGNVEQALSRYNRGTPTYQGRGDPNYVQNVKQHYEVEVRIVGSQGGPGRGTPPPPAPSDAPVPPSFLARVGGWFSPAAAHADDLSTPYVERKTRELREERRHLASPDVPPAAAPPPAGAPVRAPAAPEAAPAGGPSSPDTLITETQAAFDQPAQPADILRKAGSYGVQVLGGARDAFVEVMQTVNSLGDWMRARGIGPQWEAQIQIPEVRQAEGFDEQAVRSISQFLTAFVPGAKLVKGLGVARQITQSMLAGALTDFAAFDPDAPRLSDLLNNLPAPLKNPLTQFLAHDPDDPEAMSRLKNALEGLGLGALTDALLLAARTMGKARALKQAVPAGSGTPPVTTTMGELTDEEITAAVEAERAAGAARKAQRVQATQTALEAVQAGDVTVIQRELTQAKALVGDDGRVVMGSGPTLRHFDTPQEAAQFVLERRLARQQEAATFEPMAAVRRAVGEGEPPTPGAAAAPTVQRLAPDQAQEAQQFLNLQASGVAETLPHEGRAYYVNFDRMHRPEDVRQTVATVAEIVKEQVEAQRRGVQTTAETLAKAQQSPYQRLDTILGIEPGTVLNAEDATALRATWLAAADRLTELTARLAAGDQTATEAFLKQLVVTAGIHTRAVGVTGEMGRAFRMLGVEMPQTSRQFLDDFLQVVTQQTGQTPQQIAQKLQALPSREALAKFLRDAERASGADMFTELWYGSMLSNPTTWMVNALDSAMRTVWAIPERFLAAGMGDLKLDETVHLLYGMKAGWQEAWTAARQMWDTGMSRYGAAAKIDVPLQPAVTARNLNLGAGTLLGDAVDLLGEVARVPGKVLMTTDEWFKTINYRMELHAQAFRQAVQEGTPEDGLAARLLALVDDPPPTLHERARQFANRQTLSQPLDEAGGAFESLGRMTQHVMNAREEWLPLKLVLPFVRTPFNIARSALERTPLGLLSSNVRQALAQGGPDGALARSQMTLGSLTMALGAYLAWEGTITGRRPHDKAVAMTWERLGIQEYSVKIGDQSISYNRLEWPGFLFGLAADFATLAKTLPEATLERLAGAGVTALFDNLTSKTYVKAVGEFLDAMSPGSSYEDEVATGRDFTRFLRQRVAGLIPSGVALTAREMDPVKREVRTLYDQLLSRLPGFSEELPPSRDLWGRVRTHPEAFGPDMLSPFLTQTHRPDAVDTELLRLRLPLGMPTRAWRLPDVPGVPADAVELTPRQYDRFVVLSAGEGLPGAPPLKDSLRALMDSPAYQQLSDGPQGGKALLIRQMVGKYREAAKAQLRAEDPQVDALFRTQELTRKLSTTQQGVQELQRQRPGGVGLGIGR
jgi:hypothetical protein